MKKYTRDSFVVMSQCGQTKENFGVTVTPIRSSFYRFMWSFKIKEDSAKREKFDKTSVSGNVDFDVDFPGCPFCGAQSFYFCGHCGKMVCYNGADEQVTCPNCGNTSRLEVAESFNLQGGGM